MKATAIQKRTFTIKNSIPSESDAKITDNSKAILGRNMSRHKEKMPDLS